MRELRPSAPDKALDSAPEAAGARSLLLVLPLPIHRCGAEYFIEEQACNGLRLWLRHFDFVRLVCPLAQAEEPPPGSRAASTIPGADRLRIEPTPRVYTPLPFLRSLGPTSAHLRRCIAASSHLHFAIGGLWGDWGAVSAVVARRMGRPFAIWTDRVESAVTRFHAAEHRGARRAYRLITASLMRHLERYVIRRASLGLFHGMDCFAAYSRWCANPHLVHDVHLPPGMRIPAELLASKRARAATDRPKIIYVGRAHREKGIYDWIEALRLAEAQGHSFEALWCGSGPEFESVRRMSAGFANPVEIRPSVPHEEAIALLREADLLLFCHKTPESPRCLVEALVSGTPIVGYASPYPQDLIARHGGGVLTAADDVAALSRKLGDLLRDRALLADLAARAARDGEGLNDEAVFEHRARLMGTVPLQASNR